MVFFARNTPCPPISSFQPRSSVRVDIIKAILDVMVLVTICEIFLKNQVFVKKIIFILFFIDSIIVAARIAPSIVTISGVLFTIVKGNKGGILNSHFERNHP